jgi:LysM repeat protein
MGVFMNVSIGNAVAVHHRLTHLAFGRLALAAVLASLLVTAGCSTRRLSQPAPVEDRAGVIAPAVVQLPGAENAGKPGYFTVRPGDTLYRIALEAGQSPRDLQAWNKLTNPNLIEVGQVLRVVPPAVHPPPLGSPPRLWYPVQWHHARWTAPQRPRQHPHRTVPTTSPSFGPLRAK